MSDLPSFNHNNTPILNGATNEVVVNGTKNHSTSQPNQQAGFKAATENGAFENMTDSKVDNLYIHI